MTRVVVTGIGLVSALGQDLASSWHNLLRGKSGIRLFNHDGAKIPLAIATPQDRSPLLPKEYISPAHLPIQSSALGFLQSATNAALIDAGIAAQSSELGNCGVVIGSSRGQQQQIERALHHYKSASSNKNSNQSQAVLDLDIYKLLPNYFATAIAQQIQTQAIVTAPTAACATANWVIAYAYELIKTGQCQTVIAGSTEAPITPLGIAGFKKLGAMAKTGLYPFSQEREGLALGEGAAVLIIESLETAKQRDRPKIYGEVLGFGLTNDAGHPTSPDRDHLQAAQAIKTCLEQAGITPAQVRHINAHGTATALNDTAEASLIQRLFPHRPYISATKGATGHALGATGMIEAAFCLLSLHQQKLPPCVGLRSPAFELNFVTQALKPDRPIDVALNFSFGFGGQNAVVAFGKFEFD
ncbi:Beta-ketoacyl-acyl-carrier-protein synthase I [Thalassoporum mexicanum PCC 7367]|uniref:beta-ketoacyl synthase N-terminal-like domain-containing protein n=1 Tax=Thalassoporum mexicanum TaxID=3457544 RepID=UPI00029FFACC|nr:beta-ketoacyl synthase N-terminal-like domain-containing protein [Pseudanabaena sp. PCC 7367]AFY68587.1 Beta-ketoacyl-acyl-carrier-protein synthase I [Pseudanabaena sp. PCC 7367]